MSLFLEPRIGVKRQKFEAEPKNEILLRMREHERNRPHPSFNIMQGSIDTVKSEPRDTTPSPYCESLYGGVSPMYVNPVSPQQFQIPANYGQTPTSIPYNLSVTEGYTANSTVLPSVNILLPPWNSLGASEAQNDFGASAMSVDPPTGLSSLLDLDSQQTELKQIHLNSGELATLNVFDTHNLSENLTNNLSLTDLNAPRQDQSMTDSFTQLANNVINSICQLNDMTKPN